ncbi:major facilitator superfamily domain-containing protein [Diaporthe sp. PMI_573]|nr:major facilitator superfamily domain-containing protein [Diaporthaceae sp. PMI_573]
MACGRKNRGFLGSDGSGLSQHDKANRRQLRYEIDLNSWNLRIWMVAASGFLTDSYNLFATNVILASISFVYFPENRWAGLLMNACTLLGSVTGQLLFGFLADCYGRTRLYGIELVLVITSTLGMALGSSSGFNTLSFLGLFTFWRFITGIGIGAECNLSAVITSEWSSTSARASMISSVFLMQPVGQALAQLVGLSVLQGVNVSHDLRIMGCGLDTKYEDEYRQIIDGVWRIVIGVGAIPAVVAIFFRFLLPDSGLYVLEVKNKPRTILQDTRRIYGNPRRQYTNGAWNHRTNPSEEAMPVQFSRRDLHRYFIEQGNWLYLLGTSATWFFIDAAFCGFGLDSRTVLADVWATTASVPINSDLPCWESSFPGGTSVVPGWIDHLPVWQTDATQPCNTIYDVLLQQGKQYLTTVSVGSVLGCACFIYAVDRFPRRHLRSYATVLMVGISHFAINFGANSLTFLIPAEIFPTTYRCFCHGISAAAGKTGSILAILVVYGIDAVFVGATRQGLIFILFAVVVAFGSIFSWSYIPDVQRVIDKKLTTMSLEELGQGLEWARSEGQVFTFRDKWLEFWRKLRNFGDITEGD